MKVFPCVVLLAAIFIAQPIFSQETSSGDAKESSFHFIGLRLNHPVSYSYRYESKILYTKGDEADSEEYVNRIVIDEVKAEWREYNSVDHGDMDTNEAGKEPYTHVLEMSCSGIKVHGPEMERVARLLADQNAEVPLTVDYRVSVLIGPSAVLLKPTIVEGKSMKLHGETFKRINQGIVIALAGALPSGACKESCVS